MTRPFYGVGKLLKRKKKAATNKPVLHIGAGLRGRGESPISSGGVRKGRGRSAPAPLGDTAGAWGREERLDCSIRYKLGHKYCVQFVVKHLRHLKTLYKSLKMQN